MARHCLKRLKEQLGWAVGTYNLSFAIPALAVWALTGILDFGRGWNHGPRTHFRGGAVGDREDLESAQSNIRNCPKLFGQLGRRLQYVHAVAGVSFPM